jgi:hypothetical protein
LNLELSEGIVIRKDKEFYYEDFPNSVAKLVRVNHITSDEHWMNSEIIVNKLKE